MATTTKKLRRLRCKDCGKLGDHDDVKDDSRLCEDCEQEYVYCQICDAWFTRERTQPCYHLTWVGCDCVGFAGCGSDERFNSDYRDDVFLLLDRLPNLAEVSRIALGRDCFRARCVGFRSGWEVYDGNRVIAHVPHSVQRALLADDDLAFALAWVGSLDGKNTQEANAITVKWIDEWLARQKKGSTS